MLNNCPANLIPVLSYLGHDDKEETMDTWWQMEKIWNRMSTVIGLEMMDSKIKEAERFIPAFGLSKIERSMDQINFLLIIALVHTLANTELMF